MADNEAFVHRLFDAWNSRDYDSIRGAVADDCVLIDEGSGRTLRGPDGFTQLARSLFDAMPDGTFHLDHLTSEGDRVVIEYTGSGTQTNDLVLNVGTVPATGREVTVHGVDIYEVRGGKVKEARAYFDSGSIMSQLGLLEEKGA